MTQKIELKVNGKTYQVAVEADTKLSYVLRNDLGFKGVKYGCEQEQCGACNVLIDGVSAPSCHVAATAVQVIPSSPGVTAGRAASSRTVTKCRPAAIRRAPATPNRLGRL